MIKKILWLCNTPLPEIQDAVGIKNYNEGWLAGISNQLRNREDIIFHYAFPQDRYKHTINRTINGITFWGFYNYHKNLYRIEKKSEQKLDAIIKKINPDIIHIFGTEYPHALECIRCVANKKIVVISLQGLISELSGVYMKGIPFMNQLYGKLEGARYHCLLTENYTFYKRGKNEKKILSYVKHVIGRTEWDRGWARKRNIMCRYHHCDETLRDPFYEGAWDIKHIQRHSVFVSQAAYPIKGLHLLIPALSLVKKRYPDTKVYIAGDRSFIEEDTPYGHYIKGLIKKFDMMADVIFLGCLSAEKVKQTLIRSHVMVMSSLLENSPNSIGEAMMLGTPVVASRVGGIPDIMQNGKEGYLYHCMDKKALAAGICKIFSSDVLALRFSRNGRKTAVSRYSRSDNLEQLIKIYDGIVLRNNVASRGGR